MQYFKYTCKHDISISRLGSALGVHEGHLWVPVTLLSFFNGSIDFVEIPASYATSIALIMKKSEGVCPMERIIFDKEAILRKMNASHVKEESVLRLPITCSPNDSWTLFVEPKGYKDLLLASGTVVLCVEKNIQEKVGHPIGYEGSLEDPKRQQRQIKKYKKNAERRVNRKRIQEEFQNKLANLSAETASLPSFQVIRRARELTVDKIKDSNNISPLHYLPQSFRMGSTVTVRRTKWIHPDPGVLYHVFRPQGTENSIVNRESFSDPIFFPVAFFFLNGVLLSFPSPHDPDLGEQQFQFLPHEHFKHVETALQQCYQKGYRIVILEHIPSLHYGSSNHIEMCLGSISDAMSALVNETGCTVTVLLSPASSIFSFYSVEGDDRLGFSSSLPELWECFIKFFHGFGKPDPATSFVVGASSNECPAKSSMHKQFAMSASLEYKELDLFLELQV